MHPDEALSQLQKMRLGKSAGWDGHTKEALLYVSGELLEQLAFFSETIHDERAELSC